MFRPQITVVDCTLRDGGLMNNSRFTDEVVSGVYKAICAAGIQVVELGYRNSKKLLSTDDYGPWRFCDEESLRRVVDGVEPNNTKIAIMMDAHKSELDDLLPKSDSVVDMVRVATYVKDADKAIALANDATQKGYETTINIMAISHSLDRELDEALQQIEEETKIAACYIVDSYGALYSEDIDYYIDKYKKHLKTKEIGMHCHNQQQLAFANTIEAVIKDVNYLDGTLLGIGRAAGNCPLELLLGFLKNPKFDIRPVLDAIGEHILPLRDEMEWGYHVPYMISGMLNVHPQESITVMQRDADDPVRRDFRKFYDQCLESAR